MTDKRHPEETPRRVPAVDKRASTKSGSPEGRHSDAGSPEGRPSEDGAGEQPAPSVAPPIDELAEAKQLADDRLDQLLRLKADFENYRKRVIREQTELVERASLRVVEQLLPVFDDFERAVNALRAHTDDDALVRGLEIVLERLRGVLEAEGLERVVAEGAFDPHEHEAVSSVPGDVSEPTILEVVRPGYRLRGKTIRPALVHVTMPSEGGEA
jgi:molecular chaperone GrpE